MNWIVQYTVLVAVNRNTTEQEKKDSDWKTLATFDSRENDGKCLGPS